MRVSYKRIIINLFFIVTNICFSQNLTHKDIMKFFDFNGIENLQKIQENITLLLDEHLKLSSGQHLWEAFLYLDEKCQNKFTFKFTFEVNEGGWSRH